MRILGIETSCDETAAAIVECDEAGQGHILSNIIWTQTEHTTYGGVVPEIAARAHVEKLDELILQALKQSKSSWQEISAIAATAGPGLIGGLMVGLVTAKALCLALNKPLIAVNHLEGHALTARLSHNIAFPYLLLLVSGGHTQLLLIKDFQNYERLGTTIDDALGEAFDKTAKLLGLGYPGGPAVEDKAQQGCASAYNFPRPLKGKPGFDFSFSGLKTAIRHCIEQENVTQTGLTDKKIADICASFQTAICDILNNRAQAAMLYFSQQYTQAKPVFVVSGGVAANQQIRNQLQNLCQANEFEFIAPPQNLCSDNAAMIAWAGAEHFARGNCSSLAFAAKSRWRLDENATIALGSGKKGAKA
ncbi:tRNA (adenosine(37)-N6)-threonylcarbamoyltransferase complex transferase subunit TsaD [Bartonella sp. TP]|uniref:tRNA (adenosine(37)-N6)-threonylcarbamoyltransferase complex transferase subunit TsaD n=1 Tax=Bartonella sp. TP TaxID=3057550 RepID=UPI0025AF2499|nr:tRNA (adenosine(37)-N6)-threonylcarbamoyltransferase complex transferase subunit TsaD [Bartonella sp. TP]WJW79542.1 tRNA (adenosine(37)-N6)-threonylcarbamoyltransferase complex transferase subunit TsaD [Bartonella sp. TP]